MDVREEEILGPGVRNHWYYVAKGRALLNYLEHETCSTLVDVGAGSGVFSKLFLDSGHAERAICVDPAYAHENKTSHNGSDLEFTRRLPDGIKADLILMIDVLEHVEDDVDLLQTYAAPLASNGKILISVPAFQFLWSGHDVFLEHHRRYRLTEIEGVARKSGLRVIRSSYFYGSIFPLVLFVRALERLRNWTLPRPPASQLRPASPWINKALIALLDAERKTVFRHNRLAGVSAFCLCEKL